MTGFKFAIGDVLLTYDGFVVEIVKQIEDPETKNKYYACKSLELETFEREVPESGLEKTVHFEEGEGYYDSSPFIGNCWRFPVYMVKEGKRHFVINRCSNDNALSRYKRESIQFQLIKTKGKYVKFHGICDSPYSFLDFVCKRRATLERPSRGLFDEHEDSTDFGGNIREVSAAFKYRIYDNEMIDRIKSIVSLIDSRKYEEAEALISKHL